MQLGRTQRLADDSAFNVLNKHCLDENGRISLPLDTVEVARRLGIGLEWDDDPNMSSERSGYSQLDSEGKPKIFVNPKQGRERMRFTVAHEIGHIYRAMCDGTIDQLVPHDRAELATQGTDDDEIYANTFAAELVMPEAIVRRWVEEAVPFTKLMARFGVSKSALTNRLNNLELA
ncbi:MAG: ImmA/IrrE family metallo-endopeptidase [Propionibacteriaceae bacterium]|nr:ImmA/IrrE family metallo-endopeptidase [Propionibacteriaceae bacterium]